MEWLKGSKFATKKELTLRVEPLEQKIGKLEEGIKKEACR